MPYATSLRPGFRQWGHAWIQVAVAAAFAIGCAGNALAGDSASAGASGATTARDSGNITSLDEVVVTGKLDSLSGIRAAIKDSEERFYARYNELNKDREYEIICRHEAPTGSRIARDNCQAQIVDERSAEQVLQAMLSGHPGTVPTTPLSVLRNDAAAVMRERTLQFLRTDPQLMQDLLQHAKLEGLYQQMVRRKFKGWPGVR